MRFSALSHFQLTPVSGGASAQPPTAAALSLSQDAARSNHPPVSHSGWPERRRGRWQPDWPARAAGPGRAFAMNPSLSDSICLVTAHACRPN